jgi:hypothetical protein
MEGEYGVGDWTAISLRDGGGSSCASERSEKDDNDNESCKSGSDNAAVLFGSATRARLSRVCYSDNLDNDNAAGLQREKSHGAQVLKLMKTCELLKEVKQT